MNKLFLILFPLALMAQSYLVSSIPVPKTYIQNLDPYPCDEICLQEYLDKEMIFSFLAHTDSKIDNPELNDQRLIYISLFNLGASAYSNELKIALLLPQKVIGRYAASTTNAVFAYMLTRNRNFSIKTFSIDSEDKDVVEGMIDTIQREGFYYVIAPMTQKGAQALVELRPEINIFIPTINRNDVTTNSPYLYFGGIDYHAQNELLLKESVEPLVVYYDNSRLGKKLTVDVQETYNAPPEANVTNDEGLFSFMSAPKEPEELPVVEKKSAYAYAINRRITNLKAQLKDNEKIQNASFFLNTPVVKSGMVLSQLTLYDVNVTNILSTQINYDPLILSMTQYQDREKMVIANSISENNKIMIETNALLSNDIVYDWINYATTIGADYFYNKITRAEREYTIPVLENQIQYPTVLVQPSFSRFIPYVRPIEAAEEVKPD